MRKKVPVIAVKGGEEAAARLAGLRGRSEYRVG